MNALLYLDHQQLCFQCRDQKYEMDHKDLEAKYKALMKKLHPDLFHGKSKVLCFTLLAL
jgi:uncharacterized protein YecT (DUF1311 family)